MTANGCEQCTVWSTQNIFRKTKKKEYSQNLGEKNLLQLKKIYLKKTLNYGKNDKLLKNILKKHTENHLSST